ncbi:hypothetical protein [Apibacter adventoris]|uniref:T9SS C-terminal target domain-containing protein n=1 Tax=Apibacter adventoris TaxID=1679466 RepID=A0A2S8AB17_9FLAO|nr:hypothetical protein [Apibacter adventoris]PQL91754.1 hypothetical protein C4S77_08105 [Apibacter adventoris]
MKTLVMKIYALFFLFFTNFLPAQNKTDTLNLSEIPIQFTLSKKIHETSGVEFYNDFLYTLNDSGNQPEIYKLSSQNGEILQTIKIKDATNVDWEETARKGDTLFIGDFGNNLGNRKDLTIYSIIIPQETLSKNIEVNILHTYYFNFEDQINFNNKEYLVTNFDCEAFVYYDKKLHIFTKRWGDYQTTHYELNLNTTKKTLTAKKIETFNTECVITGADIYNKELYLIGYTKDGFAYTWKFINFSDGKFFNGEAQKTFIGLTPMISQTEGIAISKDKIYITGEEMNYSLFKVQPTLYIIDKNKL